jgi:DNA-binding SARP family transcriptional activator
MFNFPITKCLNKCVVCLFVFFLKSFTCFSQDYGLTFNGQNYSLDQRTSLDLTPDDFLSLDEEFDISFDLKINLKDKGNLFGYILRVINDNYQNIDLIVSNSASPNGRLSKLNVVIGDTETVIPINYLDFNKYNWIKLGLRFSLNDKRLVFSVRDSVVLEIDVDFKKRESFKFIFGANNYHQFATTDLPSMSIRDIKLFKNKKLLNHYPLNEINGDLALDKITKNRAKVANPNWLMHKHNEWQNVLQDEIEGYQLVAADSINNVIYLLREKELMVYDLDTKNQTIVKYKNSLFVLDNYHRAVYNYTEKKIYCYLIDKNFVSKLNVETGFWELKPTNQVSSYKQKYQHHNSIYNQLDNSIYTFGGYGQHEYSNEVMRVDFRDGISKVLSINDSIFYPRYLAGITSLNDTIYLFGGYGSASGSQLVNPKHYFDLLGYSVKNKKFIKKFEIPQISEHMVVGNNFWIDSKNRDFYALISDKTKFDGFLQLLRGNLDKPEADLVGDKIPFKFLDVKSFATLFYMPKQKKLLAYTSFIKDTVTTEFKIYTIEFPPLLYNLTTTEPELETHKYSYVIIVFLMLIGIGFIFYFYLNKKLLKRKNQNDIVKIENSNNSEYNIDYKPNVKIGEYQIIFFGGFQVIDKEQNDITNKFSPLLKELFLLIWLYTFKNNKGISSEKLVEFLWYDKSSRKAQNNRSVNITKLRTLLKEIGYCDLTKDTGYWKIIFEPKKLKSDYFDLIQITEDEKNITKDRVDLLIKITQKGSFLSNLNYEWLDYFNADISDRIINTLTNYVQNEDIEKDPDFIIHLSDCIFNFDSINEDAMIYKCKAQYMMGKHSLAEGTFKKFEKEYKLLYAQDYEYSYQDILNQN